MKFSPRLNRKIVVAVAATIFASDAQARFKDNDLDGGTSANTKSATHSVEDLQKYAMAFDRNDISINGKGYHGSLPTIPAVEMSRLWWLKIFAPMTIWNRERGRPDPSRWF
jgi:hypothetical protein